VQNLIYAFGETANSNGVNLGFGPIWQVFTGAYKNDAAMQTIFSFGSALKTANPNVASSISSLLNAQQISGDTIQNFAQTEMNAPDTVRDLPVYQTLDATTPQRVCSRNFYQQQASTTSNNKLSITRYLRFDTSAPGNYKITVTPERTDPVKGGLAGLNIYKQGRNIACASGASNIESLVAGAAVALNCSMENTSYVFAVYQTDFSNDTNALSGIYDQCFAVKAEAQ
jgi:hypothetical protein